MTPQKTNENVESIDSVAIIAGQGYLPREVYKACIKKDIRVEIIRLDKQNEDVFSDVKTHCIPVHAISNIIETIKLHNIKHIVLAGYVKRASIPKLMLDIKGAKLLTKIIKHGFSDAALLNSIILFLEKEGFTIVPSEQIATDIIAESGNLTNVRISKDNMEDIKFGIKILEGMSKFDMGQALVIQNRLILGVEAAEGTDELIKRCGVIQQKFGTEPVLVKICKPKQDRRVDLPCIGDETIKFLKEFKIKGVAVQANASLILNREKAIETANKNNIFIYGYDM